MIEIKKLSKVFQGNSVIQKLNLDINKGEFVFLQGESGSGKSTMLKILYRDLEDFKGDIFIDDQSIRTLPKYMIRRIIGVIFQSFELLDRKTVIENIALAGEVLGQNEEIIQAEAKKLIEKVGLKGKEKAYPNQLSGGEQQRVAIARALLNRPKILLADEPTGNLDSKTAIKIMKLLREINEHEGITVLAVTHSDELVRAFPARVLMMDDGKVKEYEHA
ncbi:cell division ATP-binding protein FtsE [Alkalihalobacillus sp. AL-G]|uniref:cell division ATP-binding protein FtsE n=1 Tax=Alkalihalobacillus sp. AL-G TaxID=2926399 RepID=UPI00272D7E09|nr:ABC transporter ATP-binding protein [Alkalihalobacillus sp. AL-G]WLD94520.1 ABC transporter ATP-binding protein [Alkalihalobacillus sp. AL-G]